MSQRNRIVIAALALAALLLASPSPSRAAGLRESRLPGIGALEQIWTWVISFWPDREAPQPANAWEKEGSVINPNGQPSSSSTPPAASAQEEDPGT
jgi:hypothetical protein